MKVLTSAEMRDADRQTIALGIPEAILMENAGMAVTAFLVERFRPMTDQRVVIFCGKGNNGGDGLVVARHLRTRYRLGSLHVILDPAAEESDALRMFRACGGQVVHEVTGDMQSATVVVDALLGTGLSGPARGISLEWIRAINSGFPRARVVAVDIPSGMASDSGTTHGEFARANACITFTAPKPCHIFPPNCDKLGEWRVARIGTPDSLLSSATLNLNEPSLFAHLLKARVAESNKGLYGHVLVVGGAPGKVGAAEMAGLSALRAGAGLVTVACASDRLFTPELMSEHLPATFAEFEAAATRMNVVAIGPGLGSDSAELVLDAVRALPKPTVIDADGLNSLVGYEWHAGEQLRILTPHPGEMARLAGTSVPAVQGHRLQTARTFSSKTGSVVVLKGNRTVIAFPDGQAYVNPTGSPAMATGGTGDILTGLIAGFLAQFPGDATACVLAAVYLHGLAGTIGSRHLTEQTLIATDLLHYLPEAMRECARVPDEL